MLKTNKNIFIIMQTYLNPEYIRGLTDGEGNFHISINPRPGYRTGFHVFLVFQIGQSGEIGKSLLLEIAKFFGCGKVVRISRKGSITKADLQNEDAFSYQVYSIHDIWMKIIPFFDTYQPIVKRREYEKWRAAAQIIRCGGHLSRRGIEQIRKIREEQEVTVQENNLLPFLG
jgi:hypothetical protein